MGLNSYELPRSRGNALNPPATRPPVMNHRLLVRQLKPLLIQMRLLLDYSQVPRVCGLSTKPDFIIIGAQKAGTSALFTILKQHKDLVGAYKKEVHFFDHDSVYSKNNYARYHSYFPLSFQLPNDFRLYEATPSYLYHPRVAQRLHEYRPDLKLIIVLREPAQRALSAWTMYHYLFEQVKSFRPWHDPRSFQEAISEEIRNVEADNYYSNLRGYVKRGLYYDQIQEYLKYFNRDQLLVLEHDELKSHFDHTVERITEFLEVPYQKLHPVTKNPSRIVTKNQYAAELSALREFYSPHNQKLYSLLGTTYNWNP